jgi:hypothetical protein
VQSIANLASTNYTNQAYLSRIIAPNARTVTDLLLRDGDHGVAVHAEHRHDVCQELQRRVAQLVLLVQRCLAQVLCHLQGRDGVEQQPQEHDGLIRYQPKKAIEPSPPLPLPPHN